MSAELPASHLKLHRCTARTACSTAASALSHAGLEYPLELVFDHPCLHLLSGRAAAQIKDSKLCRSHPAYCAKGF